MGGANRGNCSRSAFGPRSYGLRICRNQEQGKVPVGTEFPIFIEETRYRSTERVGSLYKIRGLADDAQAVIENIQPWQRRENPEGHRLWALQEISNWDKHRLLHLTNVVAAVNNITLTSKGSGTVKQTFTCPDGPVGRWNRTCLFYHQRPSQFPGEVNVDADIIYDIAFDKTGPGRGSTVTGGVDQLGKVVFEILTLLSRLP